MSQFVYGQSSFKFFLEDERDLSNNLEICTGKAALHQQWMNSSQLYSSLYSLEVKYARIQELLKKSREFKDSIRIIPDGIESSLSKMNYVDSTVNSHQNGFFKDSHFWQEVGPNYGILIDPLIEIKGGGLSHNTFKTIMVNRRGLRLEAWLGKRVKLVSRVIDNQILVPEYLENYVMRTGNFPGSSFLKDYQSSLLKNSKGYDYLYADGEFSADLGKYFQLGMGHGRHQLGDGIRSLLLSDFSTSRFFIRLNAQAGRFQYQSLFYELAANSSYAVGAAGLLDKKYLSNHSLGIRLGKNGIIGIMESVVYSRGKGFELQYLNPVILYRFVEQALGSPDNVLMGLHGSYILKGRVKLYGQVLLDEFLLKRLIESMGWWGNKIAFQAGVRYPEVLGISGFDFQGEINIVRPFTYAYSDSIINYTHQNQALAHPLGSNFIELLLRLKYQSASQWNIQYVCNSYIQGRDKGTENFGSNILRDSDERMRDFGYKIGDGMQAMVFHHSLMASWKFWTRSWVDLDIHYRRESFSQTSSDEFWVMLGVRMNLERLYQNLIF